MRGFSAAHSFKLLKKFAFSSSALLLAACAAPVYMDNNERWAVYYGDEAAPELFSPYRLVVLDSAAHPDIEATKQHVGSVLGYVSIAEVDITHDPADAPATLIEKNPLWNSQLVDIRQRDWQDYILNKKVPAVLAKGFDGVMLDTIDSALYLEEKDPQRFAGMKESAIYLVKAMRHRHPNMKIMVNRGIAIWPEIAKDVNFILAESTYTLTDLAARKPHLQSDDAYRQYLEKLAEAKTYNKKLKIYTLDYWDMNDTKGVLHIYDVQRSQGFVPYVTTPDLKNIHHEIKASIIAPSGEEGFVYA